ncbi:SLC13 family permease [Roseibium sp.]|uniref:SLC13 family permease n=1 Tax=Roseibium sp. TaxID=1936156 RepID=UPI003D11537E
MSWKPGWLSLSAVANITGLVVALAGVALPPLAGLDAGAQAAGGIGLLMAVLWVTETVPLAVTALIPVVLFPLAGIASLADLSGSYANPVIFLFLGGFMIAKGIEKWGLHRRLAFAILARTHGEPRRVVLSVMAATAFLSLWISNTASTMVAAPIAASIAAMRGKDDGFGTALMLGVAYAATIGGMGSLIGTPPNALFAAYMAETHGIVIGFAEWMLVGLPVVIVLLPVTWVFLTHAAFRIGPEPITLDFSNATPLSRGEKRLAVVAGLTALGWITRPLVSEAFPGLALSDAGIAMTGALALFVIGSGVRPGERLLDWETAASLRWDVLILFGGGLSLATAIERTGLAAWIGVQAEGLEGLPTLWILLSMSLVIVYLGELASNTAMAAIFLPVAGAAAVGIGADPLTFTLPVALAASIGFMLPVATPPNAIVFANPLVTRPAMLRAGAPLDLIGIAVALLAGLVMGPMVF